MYSIRKLPPILPALLSLFSLQLDRLKSSNEVIDAAALRAWKRGTRKPAQWPGYVFGSEQPAALFALVQVVVYDCSELRGERQDCPEQHDAHG